MATRGADFNTPNLPVEQRDQRQQQKEEEVKPELKSGRVSGRPIQRLSMDSATRASSTATRIRPPSVLESRAKFSNFAIRPNAAFTLSHQIDTLTSNIATLKQGGYAEKAADLELTLKTLKSCHAARVNVHTQESISRTGRSTVNAVRVELRNLQKMAALPHSPEAHQAIGQTLRSLQRVLDRAEKRAQDINQRSGMGSERYQATKRVLADCKHEQAKISQELEKFPIGTTRAGNQKVFSQVPTKVQAETSRATLAERRHTSPPTAFTVAEAAGQAPKATLDTQDIAKNVLSLKSQMESRLEDLKNQLLQPKEDFPSLDAEVQKYENTIATLESQIDELAAQAPALCTRFKAEVNSLKETLATINQFPNQAVAYSAAKIHSQEFVREAQRDPAQALGKLEQAYSLCASLQAPFSDMALDALNKTAAPFLQLNSDEEAALNAVVKGQKSVGDLSPKTLSSILQKEMLSELYVQPASKEGRLEKLLVLLPEAQLQKLASSDSSFKAVHDTYMKDSGFKESKEFFGTGLSTVSESVALAKKTEVDLAKPKGFLSSIASLVGSKSAKYPYHEAMQGLENAQAKLNEMKSEANVDAAKLAFVKSLQSELNVAKMNLEKLAHLAVPSLTKEQTQALKKLDAAETRAQELSKANPKALAQALSADIMLVLYSPDKGQVEESFNRTSLILQALDSHPAKEAILSELNKLSPSIVGAFRDVQAKKAACAEIRQEMHQGLEKIRTLTDRAQIAKSLAELKSTLEAKWPAPISELYSMTGDEERAFKALETERNGLLAKSGNASALLPKYEQFYTKYLWQQLLLNAGEFMSWSSDDPKKATFTSAKDRLKGSESPEIATIIQMYEDFNVRPKNKTQESLEKESRNLAINCLDNLFSVTNYTNHALSVGPNVPGVTSTTFNQLQEQSQELEKIVVAFKSDLFECLSPEAQAKRTAVDQQIRELRRTGAPTAEINRLEQEKQKIGQEGLDLQKALKVILKYGEPYFKAYSEVFTTIDKMQHETKEWMTNIPPGEDRQKILETIAQEPIVQEALVKLKEDMGASTVPAIDKAWDGIFGGFIRLQAGSLVLQCEALLQFTATNAEARPQLLQLNQQLRAIQAETNKRL